MTAFRDVFGSKLGHILDQNWPYIFLALSVYLILYSIGVWKVIYKLAKQLVVMSVMVACCMVWYVLMTQHWSALTQVGTTMIVATLHDALFGDAKPLLANGAILQPLSEMFVVTGATLFLIGVLYRQLPIDLIPDCIPCIGQYDNMLASMCALTGLVICAAGIYVQIIYFSESSGANSSNTILNTSKLYFHSAQDFIHSDDVRKWDSVVSNTQAFLARAQEIITHSCKFVYNQVVQKVQDASKPKHNDL